MNARIALFALVVFLFSSVARAGAFDPKHVPATAPWIVHVDLDALSRSTILKSLHSDGVKFENEFDLDDIEQSFGLSPFQDLRSLTLYGAGATNGEVVYVAVGGDELAVATTRLSTQGARTVRAGNVDALQFGRPNEPYFAALLSHAPGSDRIAVVASSQAALGAAIQVLQNEAPSLASATTGKSQSIITRPKRGSLVFAASAPVAKYQDNEPYLHRALELLCDFSVVTEPDELLFALATRAIDFELTETHGEMHLMLGIDASAPAKAKEMEAALRAAVARCAQESDRGELAARVTKLVLALRIETLASRLRVSYRYPSAAWVEDIHFVEAKRGIRKN